MWINEDEKGDKNLHEAELLEQILVRSRKETSVKHSYTKITQVNEARDFTGYGFPDARTKPECDRL